MLEAALINRSESFLQDENKILIYLERIGITMAYLSAVTGRTVERLFAQVPSCVHSGQALSAQQIFTVLKATESAEMQGELAAQNVTPHGVTVAHLTRATGQTPSTLSERIGEDITSFAQRLTADQVFLALTNVERVAA